MQKVSEALCAIQVNLAKGKTSISTGPSIPPQIHELPSNIRHDLHSQKHYLHSNDSSFVANPLVKQSCPISTHNSSGISHELPRRMSAASLSEYVDIDKLIGDIKISPMQNNLLPHIVTIKKELNNLKHYKPIADEVATIELLLQSINNKLTSENKLRPSSLRHRASMAVTQ